MRAIYNLAFHAFSPLENLHKEKRVLRVISPLSQGFKYIWGQFGTWMETKTGNYFTVVKLGLLRLWIPRIKRKEGREHERYHHVSLKKNVLIFNSSR
jgi:hypothetical protein